MLCSVTDDSSFGVSAGLAAAGDSAGFVSFSCAFTAKGTIATNNSNPIHVLSPSGLFMMTLLALSWVSPHYETGDSDPPVRRIEDPFCFGKIVLQLLAEQNRKKA